MSSIHKRKTAAGATHWRVTWRDHEGKQRGKHFTTQRGAEKWKALLDVVGPARALAALDAPPTSEGDRKTVAQQVSDHVDSLTGVTAGTRRVYRSHLRRIIEPTPIGSIPLGMLTVADVARWVNDLDESGVAAKTLANYHGLLSSALKSAVRDGLIPSNPSAGMRLPRGDHEAREMTFLSSEQFALLLESMTPHYRPLVLMLVGTGMRFGEATALRVRDVDILEETARITRAWKYTATSSREIGAPKTVRSNRTVTIARHVIPFLDVERAADDYLFVAPKGGPVRQPVFFTSWRKAVAPLGVPVRVHDLRHTFASWAIQSGIPLPTIQKQLGHESITTTVDRYGHITRSDFDALNLATSARLAVAAERVAHPTTLKSGTPLPEALSS